METDEAVVTTSTIDGFLVHHNHEKAQNSGDVVVILGDDKRSAMFTMSYTGINAQEALAMAKRFDWKKMQAATAALH
ncbi:MAG: hypothetical protein ACXV8I_08045 [Methylobacter sp.]